MFKHFHLLSIDNIVAENEGLLEEQEKTTVSVWGPIISLDLHS